MRDQSGLFDRNSMISSSTNFLNPSSSSLADLRNNPEEINPVFRVEWAPNFILSKRYDKRTLDNEVFNRFISH